MYNLNKLFKEKLEEVINQYQSRDKDLHRFSPQYYVSLLARYLMKEDERRELSPKGRRIILDMPIKKLRHALWYRGLSFLED